MIPLLSFNVPEKTDWTKVFQKHIEKTLKKPEAWQECCPHIQKLTIDRDRFDFQKQNSVLKVDPSWVTIQMAIEDYLRNINFISSRFKFGTGKEAVDGFKSVWKLKASDQTVQFHLQNSTVEFIYQILIL